jgi:hypothetical protein
MDVQPKVKRRIVPTLIGPTTSAIPIQIAEPTKQASINSSTHILEKQTQLLGPALVYKIATGKATQQDIEDRVSYLNNLGQNWTIDSLLKETEVKTSMEYNRHIQDWIDKWQPIALEEEKRKTRRKTNRKSKKRSKSRAKLSRKRKSRQTNKYNPHKCLEYSILKSRQYAKRKGIVLGRKLRKKMDICSHIVRSISSRK